MLAVAVLAGCSKDDPVNAAPTASADSGIQAAPVVEHYPVTPTQVDSFKVATLDIESPAFLTFKVDLRVEPLPRTSFASVVPVASDTSNASSTRYRTDEVNASRFARSDRSSRT